MEAYQEGNNRYEDGCSFVQHIEAHFNLIVPSLPMKLVFTDNIDTLLKGSFPGHKSVCQL
jgi:hypothetical protein